MDPMQLQMLMMVAQNPELAATALAQSGIGPPKERVGALGQGGQPQAAAPQGAPQGAPAEGAPAGGQGIQQLLMNSLPFVQAMQPQQMPPPPAPAPFVRGPIGNAQTSQNLMQMLMAGAGGGQPPSLGSLIAGG